MAPLFEHSATATSRRSDIVTHRIPLENIAEGYHMFSSKLDEVHQAADRARAPA